MQRDFSGLLLTLNKQYSQRDNYSDHFTKMASKRRLAEQPGFSPWDHLEDRVPRPVHLQNKSSNQALATSQDDNLATVSSAQPPAHVREQHLVLSLGLPSDQ